MFKLLVDEKVLEDRLGQPIGHPLRLFQLDDCSVNGRQFIADILPSFNDLAWDLYTVKNEQVDFLKKHVKEESERIERFFIDYYSRISSLSDINDIIGRLIPEDLLAFNAIKPYRRRSISRFDVTYDATSQHWSIERLPVSDFSQDTRDYRMHSRVFNQTALSVTNHPVFNQILCYLAQMVKNIHREVLHLQIICHQMGLVVSTQKNVSNSPEGIHQDGANYIVSALVIERRGITGGISTVYGPDKKTKYLSTILTSGQGLFHADHGSDLWHDITPIEIEPSFMAYEGVRNILGFDIFLLQ